MFSGDFTFSRDSDGAVFLDRSGEHFNFILDYLRGNIVGIDDVWSDERTRKKLVKEAEYYQLEGMKNILAFKSSSVEKEDDGDGKAAIIEIVENVIQNKEAIRNVLDESRSNERRVPIEENRARLSELQGSWFFDQNGDHCTETLAPKTFENEIWDGENLENTHFEHDITFKQCNFVSTKFNYCRFNKNVVVSFDRCDLINTSFHSASFNGKIHFDGSDLRSANFTSINDLPDKIQYGKVTFNKVKYANLAKFDSRAINAIITLMNKIN